MTVDIRPFPRLGWDPLPETASSASSVAVWSGKTSFFVAQLRFSEHATIHEHPGERDTIVAASKARATPRSATRPRRSAKGSRFAGRQAFRTGLWTEGSTMSTLMIERFD